MKAFLNQSCDQGPNHTPCLAVWQQLASNESTAAILYGVSYWNGIILTELLYNTIKLNRNASRRTRETARSATLIVKQ